MKKLITIFFLLSIIIGEAQNQSCFHEDSIILYDDKKEIIMMGGVSSHKAGAFFSEDVVFLPWETKFPKERLSKYAYKTCIIIITADANNDTSADRITVYYDGVPLFIKEFTDETFEPLICVFDVPGKLRFVVDNKWTKNNTPAAFSVKINISGQVSLN